MKKKPLTNKAGDVRELTREDFKYARRMRDADPKLVAAYEKGAIRYRGQRGPQKAPTKAQVTLRIDRNVLAFFKGRGAGWQTRISDALKAIVEAAR